MKVFAPQNAVHAGHSSYQRYGSSPAAQHYARFGRAYTSNELVYAAVEMLATSAQEPHIIGRKWTRESPRIGRTSSPSAGMPPAYVAALANPAAMRDFLRNEHKRLISCGLSSREAKERMITNGFFKPLPSHPLVTLLREPNPWMSRGQMWGTVVMDRSLAGNSYLYKARMQDGMMKGAPTELWRLRPDRVKIIPSKTKFIEAYEYGEGDNVVRFPPEDVIHFKTRNPFDDYYGMPPLLPIAGRIGIDEYMQGFLRQFFEQGGTGPGAILSVKQKLSEPNKDTLRGKYKETFGGAAFHELMILDQAETSYTPLTLDRGLRDALPKEIDAQTEARILMVFGIPPSLIGALIGLESSSYANKRQDWQVLWDLTMTPLLSDLDDVLNLRLVPEFGGIDEVLFDLSDIRALQEDVDAVQERHRKNVAAGLESWEEGREAIGLDPEETDGKTFFVPVSINPTLGEDVPKVALPGAPEDDQDEEDEEPETIEARHHCGALIAKDVQGDPELHCHKCRVQFRPSDPPPMATITELVRGEDGRVTGSVSREEVAT